MNIKIYQINSERDSNRVKFMGLKFIHDICPGIYDEVFSGDVDCGNLEDVYRKFNTGGHPLHRGHSLSVSDVVLTEDRAFYCDTVGFKEIDFDESQAHKPDNLLKIVYVEPNRPPFVSEVPDELRALQKAVGGHIEPIGIGDNILLVGNEEAKLMGMEGNRLIGDSIIAGPFFLVGKDGENFRSLTDKETQLCMERFANCKPIHKTNIELSSIYNQSRIPKTENLLSWIKDHAGAERLKQYLQDKNKNGNISQLTFIPGSLGSLAYFVYMGNADEFLKKLSKENPGVFLISQSLIEDSQKCTSTCWESGNIAENEPHRNEEDMNMAKYIQTEIRAGRNYAKFKGILEGSWTKYREELHNLDKDEIIDKAQEIAGTEYCYKSLCSLPYQSTHIGYLLQFADPLEVVRDEWLEHEGYDKTEDFDHVLWYMADQRDVEQEYEMIQPPGTEISM